MGFLIFCLGVAIIAAISPRAACALVAVVGLVLCTVFVVAGAIDIAKALK